MIQLTSKEIKALSWEAYQEIRDRDHWIRTTRIRLNSASKEDSLAVEDFLLPWKKESEHFFERLNYFRSLENKQPLISLGFSFAEDYRKP